MIFRVYATLMACVSGTAICLALAPKPAASDFRVSCDEIAHEVNDSYIEGLLTEEEARIIIERCFSLYYD